MKGKKMARLESQTLDSAAAPLKKEEEIPKLRTLASEYVWVVGMF